MKIQDKKTKVTFQCHHINARIVEVKIPGLGVGKSWKTKQAALNGEKITLQYNAARPTGVYFVYNGVVTYTKDRALLESKSLVIVERAKKQPAPEAAETTAPAAE